MTDAGADARANYLLKWDAIADFAREGFAVYDMWGLATGGIRQFKEGFGGERSSTSALATCRSARRWTPPCGSRSRRTDSPSGRGCGSWADDSGQAAENA